MRHLRGMGWVRPRHEIEEALAIQRLAITASCKAYDLGERWEAIRLATAVFTVVHDAGKKYISILSQLGLRAKLRFVASGFEYSPRNVLRETHLVSTRIYSDGTAEYLPLIQSDMADMGRLLQFREWWEREIIFRDGQFHLTRRNLVFNLRSQDGGAHFDPELRDPNYVRFAKEQLTSPLVLSNGRPPKSLLGAEWASMRQIAWELMRSLEEYEKNEQNKDAR